MSDPREGDLDNGTQPDEQSPPVAPGQGDTPGSTPASGDTPAPPDEPKPDEAEKQSRREARAFATLRRENRELYRNLGRLEAMLQQQRQPQTDETEPPQRTPQAPPQFVSEAEAELNRSILEKIEDEGPEYEKVVEKITVPGYPISTAMRDYLATSKNPAAVAKALADDRKEAQRISIMGDRAADRAMEQLEARVASKPAPRTTRAPAPVRTVGGSSSVRPDPSKMSMEEYAEWRHKRL